MTTGDTYTADGAFLHVERDDDLVIWWLDQKGESHNKLSRSALEDIGRALDHAASDDGVRGVVVVSAKPDSFVVGADVRELQAFTSRSEALALSRTAHDLIVRVRSLDKPIVAALHGAVMGGGLEFALACSMRIASEHPATRFALPEVKLGLLPGGGGTQLLPRLVGLQRSLPLLLTGKNTYPRPALRMGLVDALMHRPGLLDAAKTAARRLADGATTPDRGPDSLQARLLESNAMSRRLIYKRAAAQTEKETHGNYPAPPRIIACVREGIEHGLENGLKAEAEAFADLAMTPECEELVHLFFAKNEAERNPYDAVAPPVQRIGILGAGLMGSGIAHVSAMNGLDVVVKDQTLERAVEARREVYAAANRRVRKKAMRPFERDAAVERVAATSDYADFSRVGLVIEAAPEDAELKRQLLRDAERVTPADCIFASNTSSIPIASLATASSRPHRVIGMHYFSPVPKVPLLEIIRTDETPEEVLSSAFDIGLRQGKTIIVVRDGPGFYTTRILALYMNEALALLTAGARIPDVDETLRHAGFPMGPYELFDLVGLDVAAKITHVLADFFSERGFEPNRRADRMVEEGLKGRKTQAGFYTYKAGKKTGVNERAYDIVGANGSLPDGDVLDRLLLALVNEAAACLADGTLGSAVDGDVGAVFGLGFPPFLGGPFRYADRRGPADVVRRLNDLEVRYGRQFRPASNLQRLADRHETFYPK